MTQTIDPQDQATANDQKNPPAKNSGANDDTLLQNLQKELEDSKSKLQDLTSISQQALADLQNYKKRSEEEKIQFLGFANANLIMEILPVLDNVERATQSIPDGAKDWAQGIVGTLKQLESILTAQGLQKIPTVGQNFDPRQHEAIMTENGTADTIIKEVQAGYLLKDKVLRPAKVTVGNGENQQSASPENPA